MPNSVKLGKWAANCVVGGPRERNRRNAEGMSGIYCPTRSFCQTTAKETTTLSCCCCAVVVVVVVAVVVAVVLAPAGERRRPCRPYKDGVQLEPVLFYF